MRLTKYLLLLLVLVSSISLAQTREVLTVVKESVQPTGSYPIDAAPYLDKYYKEHGIDPTKEAPLALRKTSAWGFKVGDAKQFTLFPVLTGASYSAPVNFTCRAVGNWCYIFVEDSMWTTRVDENAVNSIKEAFDSKTPADANKGIYKTVTDIYGNPSDVDSDPRIIILVHNIREGYTGTGGYVLGFFSSADLNGQSGNTPAEIYHLDCSPLDLKKPTGNSSLATGLTTTAHEFQHMVHWNYIKSATTFFNEGFSLNSEVMCGYPIETQTTYANETNHYLLDWRYTDAVKVLNDYSRAARFFLYVYEQFGSQFFTKYLVNKSDGISGMNAVLNQLGTSRRFIDIVGDWFMANILNNKSVKPEWGYNYPNLGTVKSTTITNPNTSGSDNVYNLGSQYLTFSNGKNLSINFTDKQSNGLTIKAIKYGSGTPVLQDVPVGSTFTVPDFGTTYPKVTFAIYYSNSSSMLAGNYAAPYTYTATGTGVTGTQVISYDTTEPVGFISQTAGDSIAVHFDGIAGGKLDSIRVAIRNLTPISGRVLEFLGYQAKLGGKLFATFTANSRLSTAPSVVSSTGDYPYPQPYPNWTGVDLRSFNIASDKNFVVEFPFEDPYPGKNRILSTYSPSTGTERTPLYKASTGVWGYSGVSGKTEYSWVGLIRAYVTIGGATGIDGPVEVLPSAFKLDQNYPNPFNPSTVISYNLPKQSNVSIKIYDALGHEVRSLINEDKAAGKYNILWDSRDNAGNRVSSGVYFYTINADDFTQTKKMVLMK